MPATFTEDDFTPVIGSSGGAVPSVSEPLPFPRSRAAAAFAPTPIFTEDDFAGPFKPEDFEAGPKAAPFKGAASAWQRFAGGISKGLGAVHEISAAGDVRRLAAQAEMEREPGSAPMEVPKVPAAAIEAGIQRNPLFQAGEVAEQAAPGLTPAEQASKWTKAGEMAGGAGGMALGPLAIPAFALDAAGRHVKADFDALKANNPDITDEQAAETALDNAIKAGTVSAAVFKLVPPVARNVLEKYIVDRFGTTFFKRWLAGRVAAATETGAVMGANTAGENVATGQPVTRGVRESVEGGGIMGLLLPWLKQRPSADKSAETQPPKGGTPNAGPNPGIDELIDTIQRGRPKPAETPATEPVALGPDLAAELKAAMEKNQVPAVKPADPRISELRLEGVSAQDAQDLVAGRKTVDQVIAGNFQVTPAWNASASQERGGHAEAFEEGLDQAKRRLTNILEKGRADEAQELPQENAESAEQATPAAAAEPGVSVSSGSDEAAKMDRPELVNKFMEAVQKPELPQNQSEPAPAMWERLVSEAEADKDRRQEAREAGWRVERTGDFLDENEKEQPMWAVYHPDVGAFEHGIAWGHQGTISGTADGQFEATLKNNESGWGDSIGMFDSFEEAVRQLKTRLRQASNNFQGTTVFGANAEQSKGGVLDKLFSSFTLPPGVESEYGWQQHKGGSWYLNVTTPEGQEIKATVRDHATSPFAGKLHGSPDIVAEVSKNWTPKEVAKSLQFIEERLASKTTAAGITPSGGVGIKPKSDDLAQAAGTGPNRIEPIASSKAEELALPDRSPGNLAVSPSQPRADKGNVADLRPEEASALTGHSESPTPETVNSAIADWLDKAYEATKPGTGWTGQASMGLAKLPVWLAQEVAHGAIGIVRKAYQAGGKMAEAIEEGVAWLYERKIKGFNLDEARGWLSTAAHEASPVIERFPGETSNFKTQASGKAQASNPANPGSQAGSRLATPPTQTRDWRTVMAERDQASDDMRAALKKNDPKQAGGLSKAEVRQETALATARYRTLRDELLENPGYVEDLLTRHEKAAEAAKLQTSNSNGAHGVTRPTRDEAKAAVEDLQAELDQVKPKLLNATYDRLQKEGKLFKPPPGPPPGRSLDQLTDWLKSAGIDSPKRTLRERLALGQKEAERWTGAKDAFNQARLRLALASKTALESLAHPPKENGFRDVIKQWIFADQYTGLQTRRWVKAINDAVENPLRQMAISVWLDAQGDVGLLRYQSDAVPDQYRRIWQTALKLTAKEKELGLRVKADFEAKLEDALSAGLVKKGRADYGVPQRWKEGHAPEPDPAIVAEGRKGGPGNPRARLDPRDPFFSFQRSHDSYFDGIMAGGVPESLKLSDLVAGYNEAFHKSLSSRAAIWGLKNELAADGMPITKLSGGAHQVSENDPGAYFVDSKVRSAADTSQDGRPYRALDHFALRDWKLATITSDGKKIIVRGDMLVHPDHYDWLKNELEASPLRQGRAGKIFNPILGSVAFQKSSKFAFASFHMATVGKQLASYWVNPFNGDFEIDLRDADQALLVRNGFEIGMSGQRAAFEEGLSSHGGVFRLVPGLGDYMAKFTDYLFRDYIPTATMRTALVVLERNRGRYRGKLSENQIAELTGNQMNAASGLQNYRLLGSSKLMLDINRLLLTAPQFLISEGKVVGQAFGRYGAEQRRMLLVQGLLLYVGARALNAWLDDDHDAHWEPANMFSVVYHGRSYGLRAIVPDLFHLITDPASFASGRLGPFVKSAYEAISGRDMRTGARIKVPIETDWKPGRMAQIFIKEMAQWLVPAGLEGMLPGAAGREQTSAGSLLMSTVGITSHKYTAQTQVAGWAAAFNRHSADPHAVSQQRIRDEEPHTESTYRKLDALLDAGDLKGAHAELEALQKDGHSIERIEDRYYNVRRPFTGSGLREHQFMTALNAAQRQVYDRAIAERKARMQQFNAVVRAGK